MAKENKRIAIYIRVSTLDQATQYMDWNSKEWEKVNTFLKKENNRVRKSGKN